jgi:hypothetical protein
MVPKSLIPTGVGRVIRAVVAALLASALVAAATEPGDSATDQAADRAVLTAPPGPRTVPLELGVTVFTMWRDWEQHDQWLDQARDFAAVMSFNLAARLLGEVLPLGGDPARQRGPRPGHRGSAGARG